MKILRICLFLVALQAFGQLSAPQFPLPRDFAAPPEDLKGLSTSGPLMKAIQFKFDCKKCDGAREPGVRIGAVAVDFGTLGKGAIVVAHTADACDDRGNCSIFAFYPKDGGFASEELDKGTHFAIIRSTNPIPEIATRIRATPTTEIVHRSTYAVSKFQRTGCDSLLDKNDMGDVQVSACSR